MRRIISKSSNRVRCEAAGNKCPADPTVRERVISTPDSAACCCGPSSTSPVATNWIDSQRGYAAGSRIGRSAESQDIRKVCRARSRERPAAPYKWRMAGSCFGIAPSSLRVPRQCKRDVSSAARADRIRLFGSSGWPALSFRTRYASLFPNNAPRVWLNLLIAFLLSDFAQNGPDGFTATNAIAAAADIRITTPAMRRCGIKRLPVKQRGFFIYFFEAEVPATRSGGSSESPVQGA